jgi:hypothetical protein
MSNVCAEQIIMYNEQLLNINAQNVLTTVHMLLYDMFTVLCMMVL